MQHQLPKSRIPELDPKMSSVRAGRSPLCSHLPKPKACPSSTHTYKSELVQSNHWKRESSRPPTCGHAARLSIHHQSRARQRPEPTTQALRSTSTCTRFAGLSTPSTGAHTAACTRRLLHTFSCAPRAGQRRGSCMPIANKCAAARLLRGWVVEE